MAHAFPSVGDTVVYPTQKRGCSIAESIPVSIKGEQKSYSWLKVDKGKLTVRVPPADMPRL